ncbi:type I restriction-modification system subunit M N-terminal domain-containing protein [Rhodoferax sp.]|uniref:type I restriction-modification system subunit M N-terminal domain-containing protein n=1 Tax=Rhodoferax sp. TaxID=50421 RepID=UPI0026334FEC|nr:type I restriction-modification system subunit M N-terminal domain-containing protein [Rhodoferax sp.]MDD2918132.1 type I restriction-modification system subunit M N-terminal domain-containing protein [Rhodoferax sp.]
MLDDIKKTLWATANKLRVNMDAAEYKHLVLGLIFAKYISDILRKYKYPPDLQDAAVDLVL